MKYGVWYTTLNPFDTTGLFLHPPKTSENQRFSDVFRGCRKKLETWNGLNTENHWKPDLLGLGLGLMFRLLVLWRPNQYSLKDVTWQNLALTIELVPITRENFGPTWDKLWVVNPLSATQKMVEHTQTIRRRIADDLFECVGPFYGIGA